jgi:sec-independent protein translocase protein TatA
MEWVVLLVVVVLLFGAKRLPELARSVGRSARVFRGEIKGMASDGEQAEKTEQDEPARPTEAPRAALPAGQPAEQPAGRAAEAAGAAEPAPPSATPGGAASSNGVPGGAGSASGPSDRG